jgi:hypothetical protein
MPPEGQLQGTPYLLPQFNSLGPTRPMGAGEYFQNQSGSWSNEITGTVQDPNLNGGKPTVVPTVWIKNGQVFRVSEDEAIQLAIQSGLTFPSFADAKTAEDFSTAREANWQNIKPGDASVPALWTQPQQQAPAADPIAAFIQKLFSMPDSSVLKSLP